MFCHDLAEQVKSKKLMAVKIIGKWMSDKQMSGVEQTQGSWRIVSNKHRNEQRGIKVGDKLDHTVSSWLKAMKKKWDAIIDNKLNDVIKAWTKANSVELSSRTK